MTTRIKDFVGVITLAVEHFNKCHKYERIESIVNDNNSVELHYENLANEEYSIFVCKTYDDLYEELYKILGKSLDYSIKKFAI